MSSFFYHSSHFWKPIQLTCLFSPTLCHSLIFSGLLTNLEFLFGNFNKSVNNLPSFLTSLKLGREFNLSVNHLPPTTPLTSYFWSILQSKINCLPSSLSHLVFDKIVGIFDQPIDSIPSSIIHHLTLSHIFNQPISVLPPRLTHLSFGAKFNQFIDGCLPPTLVEFNLGAEFLQPITIIPPTLERVKLAESYPYNKSHLISSVLYVNYFTK